MKRPVKIERFGKNSFGVFYLDRKPGGRYMAAQFDSRINAIDEVIAWVKLQSKLDLVSTETNEKEYG